MLSSNNPSFRLNEPDPVVLQPRDARVQPRPHHAVLIFTKPFARLDRQTFRRGPLLLSAIFDPENAVAAGDPDDAVPAGRQIVIQYIGGFSTLVKA